MLKLIDYYADWCGPCKVMEPVLHEIEQEMKDSVEFEQVNVDDPQHQARVQQAGVMSIPTFVLEREGEEVDRKLGAMPKEAMVSWIQQHLNG